MRLMCLKFTPHRFAWHGMGSRALTCQKQKIKPGIKRNLKEPWFVSFWTFKPSIRITPLIYDDAMVSHREESYLCSNQRLSKCAFSFFSLTRVSIFFVNKYFAAPRCYMLSALCCCSFVIFFFQSLIKFYCLTRMGRPLKCSFAQFYFESEKKKAILSA